MRRRRTTRQSGFTLLEVLVASLIMAIAVTGLLAALSTSMRNAARLTDRDRAVQLARQKMDELLLASTAPRNVVFGGTWDPSLTANRPMAWRAKISPFEQPPGAAPGSTALERIELQILWTESDQPRSFTLDGYRRGILPVEEP